MTDTENPTNPAETTENPSSPWDAYQQPSEHYNHKRRRKERERTAALLKSLLEHNLMPPDKDEMETMLQQAHLLDLAFRCLLHEGITNSRDYFSIAFRAQNQYRHTLGALKMKRAAQNMDMEVM